MYRWQGFIQDFWWGGKKFVEHCHSVMHEYETIQNFLEYETTQIFKFSGGRGGFQAPLCMKPWMVLSERETSTTEVSGETSTEILFEYIYIFEEVQLKSLADTCKLVAETNRVGD